MHSQVINHVLLYARITNQFMFTMIRMQFNVHITVSLHIGTSRIISHLIINYHSIHIYPSFDILLILRSNNYHNHHKYVSTHLSIHS
ncbi:hypothetical protein HanXRQr2_Chr10g0432651 [Helianthus annuus]|uniref:Uncharacterized protein n=1 Tax=Helianthus annuus TaxID=4232 RepID=A0A9K3HX10_HELAN|nr:hypothetical protein HanXRQr2_Chr10g0432651 [Helianthus annuus]